MKQKKFYYVAVLSDGQVKLVTEIVCDKKLCRWDKDKKPIDLSRAYAEQIVYGLNLNLIPAFVLTSLYKIEEQIFVQGDKKWTLK